MARAYATRKKYISKSGKYVSHINLRDPKYNTHISKEVKAARKKAALQRKKATAAKP